MSKADFHQTTGGQPDSSRETKDVSHEPDGTALVVPVGSRIPTTRTQPGIAPPGGMEGECWIADEFDAPVDHLFDCLKDDAA